MTAARSPRPRLLGTAGERVADVVRHVALVDAEDGRESVVPEQRLLTHEEAQSLERLHAAGAATRAADAVGSLTLSKANLGHMRRAREAFQVASDGDPAEEVLEQFVTGEVGIGLQLQDLEAAASDLLGRTLVDPTLAMATAKVMRELVAISSAVRRRTEHTLTTIAGLRAQRQLLAAQRGRRGD